MKNNKIMEQRTVAYEHKSPKYNSGERLFATN